MKPKPKFKFDNQPNKPPPITGAPSAHYYCTPPRRRPPLLPDELATVPSFSHSLATSSNQRPYAWVRYTPGEPILPNQPKANEGSVKRRNEKKLIGLLRAFILFLEVIWRRGRTCKAEIVEASKFVTGYGSIG